VTKLLKGVSKKSFNLGNLEKVLHLEYNRIVEKSRLEDGGSESI